MTTQQINTTNAATSTVARPLSYKDKSAVSFWAEYIRSENGVDAGEKFEHFGMAMTEYGVYLQRIPSGIISNGYITKADGTPQLFSGAYSFYIEIDAGMGGLKGIIDYRTGLPIQNQAFVQVFVPSKDKDYADSLIQQGMVNHVLVRPNVNSSVVRFELVNPNSNLCQQFMQRDGVSSVKEIPVVLPVEGKASDISAEDARNAKRMMTRESNGTQVYNLFGNLKNILGA